MSFASQVKDELTRVKLRTREEKLAALCALTHTAGSMTLARTGVGITYATENHGTARLIMSLATSLYDVATELAVTTRQRLGARITNVRLSGAGCMPLLTDSGCLPPEGSAMLAVGHVPTEVTEDAEALRAFIRGAFLGGGSVSDPQSGYHLEIVCRYERFAMELADMIRGAGMKAGVSQRKSSYIVYIKEGESISDLLALMGAMNSTMEFEHARVVRNVRNRINRERNFEEANQNRTAQSSARQLVDVRLIFSEKGAEWLKSPLRETAEARLSNPEASLSELADMLDIKKSGVTHRLKKLSEIADGLRCGSAAGEGDINGE